MPLRGRTVEDAGPYKGVSNLPAKLKFESILHHLWESMCVLTGELAVFGGKGGLWLANISFLC